MIYIKSDNWYIGEIGSNPAVCDMNVCAFSPCHITSLYHFPIDHSAAALTLSPECEVNLSLAQNHAGGIGHLRGSGDPPGHCKDLCYQ